MTHKFDFLLSLLPMILQSIVAVETSETGPKSGAVKLSKVVDTAAIAAAAIPGIADHFQAHEVRSAITDITDASVAGLKAAGVLNGPFVERH